MPWWIWAIAAAILALAELHAPGSYLIWIALGAGFTAAAEAGLNLSLEAQLITFVACSSACCVAGYFVYRAVQVGRNNSMPLNERDRFMIGARGTICSRVMNGQGKVRIGDTVWLAEGPDMQEGTSVVVQSVRGSRLVVGPDGA